MPCEPIGAESFRRGWRKGWRKKRGGKKWGDWLTDWLRSRIRARCQHAHSLLLLNQMGEALSHETFCCRRFRRRPSATSFLLCLTYRASSSVNACCDQIQAKMCAFLSASVAYLRLTRNRASLTVWTRISQVQYFCGTKRTARFSI